MRQNPKAASIIKNGVGLPLRKNGKIKVLVNS
jgi:hypothetical protein